jgi:ABC-2 type transport system ATP-binding protein
MTERPHQYTIRSTDNRRLASVLVADVSTSAVQLVGAPAGSGAAAGDGSQDGGSLHVEAVDAARFVKARPWLEQQTGVRLLDVSPTDESLESVFSYLVNRS